MNVSVTPAVRAVFGLEIRSLLRDPRTVIISVVLPVLLIPAMLLASAWMEERRAEREEARIYSFAVAGSDSAFALELTRSFRSDVDAAGAVDTAGAAGAADDSDTADAAGAPDAAAQARRADPEAPPARFRLVHVEDARAALHADSIDFYLEALTPEEWRAERAAEAADSAARAASADGRERGEEREPAAGPPAAGTGEAAGGAGEGAAAGGASAAGAAAATGAADSLDTRVLRLRYIAPRTASRQGARAMNEHLADARRARRDSIVLEAGFPVPPDRVAEVEALNVATDEVTQGARLGRLLTALLVGLMLMGGSAVATDTLAGEKERGTLATLLTTAASREEIVHGKLLAIMAVALTIALIQVVNLWVFLGLGIVETGAAFAVNVSPGVALGLLVLYLPVIALTAGVLLLMSAHARSYKEAQLYLMPVLMVALLPTLAPLLPDLPLRSAAVLVPLANISLAARDLLIGEVHLPLFAVAWLVTAGAAAWVAGRSVRALQDEALVTGDTTREAFLGGPDLFRKQVLRWFLVFWAVKILIDFNLRFEDIRLAALVSVGVVFLAFPLLVIRHFRLNPVQALALRMPRPGVWPGVLLGVPAALLTMTALFRLMDYVLPVPRELVESFGQALMPEGIPAWQLILLLSVIPGITEELTFRGVLLHGLRRRFGPVGLALVVGLIFGVFHFQLFRIPSTAALGVILAAVTLMTGSILPAIVWHTLNNALAIFLGTRGFELELESLWWGAAGFVLLVLALRIIWRYRTPYPGVGRRGFPPGEDGGSGAGRGG